MAEKLRQGYSAPKIWELMGGGGVESVDVYYENYRVHKDQMLGRKGKGLDILLYWIAIEKIEGCIAAVALAQAALDEAREDVLLPNTASLLALAPSLDVATQEDGEFASLLDALAEDTDSETSPHDQVFADLDLLD